MEENKKKLVIDPDKCIGCGACNAIAPNNCGWGETTAVVINEEVTQEAVEAANSCPTGAIKIEEDK